MKIKLDHIYFSVSDMDKAVKFYEDFLGIKVTIEKEVDGQTLK